MTDTEKLNLLKVLANETSLAIVRVLLKSDNYVEKLAEAVGLTPATVCYHLKKMENAGVVRCTRSKFCMIYALNRDIFALTLSDLVKAEALTEESEEARREKEDAAVLSHFMKNGMLLRFHAKQSKQDVIIRHIAKQFEEDRTYTEAEVNALLASFHDDVCTLRRALISLGYMTRNNGIYRIEKHGTTE